MFCCENCFSDQYLKNYIKENGEKGDCNFCGGTNVYCIESKRLAGLFQPLVDLYTIIEDFMWAEQIRDLVDSGEGQYVWDKIDEDWQIFESLDYENQRKLFEDMFYDPREDEDHLGGPQFLDSFVEVEDDYYGISFEYKEELKAQWEKFCRALIYENRFFLNKTIDLENLKNLLPNFTSIIDKDLYRARISEDGIKIHPSNMGKPLPELCSDGRANPKGIPYLYMGSDIDTVIAEVRSRIGDKVTVGRFKVEADLQVVDLRNPRIDSPFKYGNNLKFILTYNDFMTILGQELAKPIDPIKNKLEYIPTQYLCEFIKNCGYDGVIYGSSMNSSGYNVAIFNDTNVKCINTELYQVSAGQYTLIRDDNEKRS